MGARGAPDWDQLLQQSEDLVMRDSQGFPRVERDILQVEDLSSKLRGRAARVDTTAQSLAASRLLALEGLNSQRLSHAVQSVELKPSYEDVFAAQPSASLEEHLQQVHEMSVVTAVHEAQRHTRSAFEGYMASCMDAQWAAAKRQLFEGSMPYGALTQSAGPSTPGGGMVPAAPTIASRFGFGARGPGAPAAAGAAGGSTATAGGATVQLSGRAQKYAEAVQALNQSALSGGRFDALARFAEACDDNEAGSGAAAAGGGDRRVTMRRIWQLLSSVAGEAGRLPAGEGEARLDALLQGARSYLQAGFATYVNNTIQANRSAAALGGSPGKLSVINAFLRVKARGQGPPLDFDSPGGVDTTWERLFYCLRCGYNDEALQLAKQCRDILLAGGTGGDFAAQLREWMSGGRGSAGYVAGPSMAQECERLLRDRQGLARSPPAVRYKLLVCTLLSGDSRTAELGIKETMSLLSTIEDFLWFRLSLVASGRAADAAAGGPGGLGSGGGGSAFTESYSLDDLQQYLGQYPPGHYSHNGKEPLLYAMVLLLSLQFRKAVTFLSRDDSTRRYRVDAVHVAIALHHTQLLDVADGVRPGSRADPEVAGLVQGYGKEFLHVSPELALEYYMLAASAQHATLQQKGALLRELLVETRAFGFLLGGGGSGGTGGALSRFVPSEPERLALLEAAAYECQSAAQLPEAVQLYMAAARPRPALHLINQLLADVVEPSASDAPGGSSSERYDSLVRQGNAAVQALSADASDGARREVGVFQEVRAARDLLLAEHRRDYPRALQALSQLSFLPHERFRLQLCVEGAPQLHPALAKLLPGVLLAAARALAAGHHPEQLRLLVAYAGDMPNRISQRVYQQIVKLDAEAS